MEQTNPSLELQTLINHRKPVCEQPKLSSDIDVATCQVLMALSGGTSLPAEAIESLVAINRKLASEPDEVIADSLSRQILVLEQLWLHYAARSTNPGVKPDHCALFAKAANNSQNSLLRVLSAVHQISSSKADAVQVQ